MTVSPALPVSYSGASARDAWTRGLAFFSKHLG
jgi:hypothetical protein